MALETDDREQLEPGVMFTGGGLNDFSSEVNSPDPFAGYEDYYGFDERKRIYLRDGKQWVEIKKLTEGDRNKFMKATRSDVTINSRSGDAKIPFDQAGERRELLLASVTAWHVVSRDKKTNNLALIPFDNNSPGGNLGKWINATDPTIVSDIEKQIRMYNPWLLSEMSVEQIDKEIADLQELRTAAVEREASEKNS